MIPVAVPTHVSALVELASGVRATSVFSFDSALPRIQFEVTGTEGVLAVPDPNTFRGPLKVRANEADDWRDLPVSGRTDGRGLGVLDLARAIRRGGAPRASGALALHVLQTMTAITHSAEHAEFTRIATCPTPPPPVPADWDPGAATLG